MKLVCLFLTLFFYVYGIFSFPTSDNRENNELSVLRDQVAALTKRFIDLENSTGGRLEKLESSANTSAVHPAPRETSSEVVGFTAELDQKLYNLAIGSTIVYGNVLFNAGGGYDNASGVFTCPRPGVYLLAIFVEAFNAKTAVIEIIIDGNDDTVGAVSEPIHDGDDDSGGNIRIVHLLQGQRVWVRTYDLENQYIYPGFTTFSGVLIQST